MGITVTKSGRQTRGIIDVPNDFLTKLDVNLVTVRFSLNIIPAITNDARFINITVYRNDPDMSKVRFLSNDISFSNVSHVIKRQSIALALYNKKKNASIVQRGSIPIGIGVSADLVYKLTKLKAGPGISSKSARHLMPDFDVFEVTNASRSAIPKKLSTKLQVITPINALAYLGNQRQPISKYCTKATLEGFDPAEAFSYPFPIVPAQARYYKIMVTPTLKTFDVFKSSTMSNTTRSRHIQVDLLGGRVGLYRKSPTLSALRYSTQTKMGEGWLPTTAHRKTKRTSTAFMTAIKFKLPPNLYPPKFYFVFEVTDLNGNILEKTTKASSLRDSVLQSNIQLEPPLIQAANRTRGTNRIVVWNKDPRANKAIIYRKIIDPYTQSLGVPGEFTKLRVIGASTRTPGILLDKVPPNASVLYRAIATNTLGNISVEFGCTGVRSPHMSAATALRDNQDVTIIPQKALDVDRVTIDVFNVRSTAVAFYVVGDDVTNAQPKAAPHTESSSAIQRRTYLRNSSGGSGAQKIDGSFSYSFVHGNLVLNHLYKYRVYFKNNDGTTTQARSVAYYRHERSIDKGMMLEVKNPTIGMLGSRYRVSFAVSGSFQDEGLQSVIAMIKKNNAFSSFANDITKNKASFQSLLKIGVTRHDLLTGHEVDLGVHNAGGVIRDDDIPNSPHRLPGVPPKRSGRTYRYKFRLLKASIFELLRGTIVETKDWDRFLPIGLNLTKFYNSKTLRTSMLPSYNTLDLYDPASPTPAQTFLDGETSISTFKDVELPATKTKIDNVKATTFGSSYLTIIKWTVHPNTIGIDHFQIFAEYQNVRAIVGVVHPYMSISEFTYIDTKISGLVGDKKYAVRIVYNNYSIGELSELVTVTRKTNLNYLERVVI